MKKEETHDAKTQSRSGTDDSHTMEVVTARQDTCTLYLHFAFFGAYHLCHSF